MEVLSRSHFVVYDFAGCPSDIRALTVLLSVAACWSRMCATFETGMALLVHAHRRLERSGSRVRLLHWHHHGVLRTRFFSHSDHSVTSGTITGVRRSYCGLPFAGFGKDSAFKGLVSDLCLSLCVLWERYLLASISRSLRKFFSA